MTHFINYWLNTNIFKLIYLIPSDNDDSYSVELYKLNDVLHQHWSEFWLNLPRKTFGQMLIKITKLVFFVHALN